MDGAILTEDSHNAVAVQQSIADLSLKQKDGISFPDEIVLQMLSYLRNTPGYQRTFWSCCQASRQWYNCAVPFLYERPFLYGKNFDPFAATICPSVNLHIRKSPLAGYVRHLDMGRLVHQGSRSLTARILGRVKGKLEEFVAPQASFGINGFAALAKCTKLTVLDLSLIVQAIPLDSLLRCLSQLPNLHVLYFPRLSDDDYSPPPEQWTWPPNLGELWISNGGIPDSFVRNLSGLPPTLDTLTIRRCTKVTHSALRHLLSTLAAQLRVLRVSELPQLQRTSLDSVLECCPNLKQLSVPIDNITQSFFDHQSELEYLEIVISHGETGVWGISPVDVYLAVEDEILPKLRGVCYPANLLSLSEEYDRELYTVACLLQDRNDVKISQTIPKQRTLIRMDLEQMASGGLVGAWEWYSGYEARHELRHH